MQIAEDKLFHEWQEKRKRLVKDGIVDYNSYLKAPIKLLYILKEVNGGDNWDLRNFLRAGGRVATWNNISRWQYGLENINKDILWKELQYISKEFRKKYLRNIVAVNLKKESGSTVSKSKEIWTYAWQDRHFLREQLKLYTPNVIICCGTGEIVRERRLLGRIDKWSKTSNGVEFCVLMDCVVLNYCHPAKRDFSEKLFFSLRNACREILLNI